jgi:hypothetical protein
MNRLKADAVSRNWNGSVGELLYEDVAIKQQLLDALVLVRCLHCICCADQAPSIAAGLEH